MWSEIHAPDAGGRRSGTVAPREPLGLLLEQVAARAAEILDPASRQSVAAFVRAQMAADGGFRGRGPVSDLYYTLFALQCLRALGQPLPAATRRVLAEQPLAELDLVHLGCLARARKLLGMSGDRALLAARIADHRAADGAYRLRAAAPTSSVYAGFLALLALEACAAVNLTDGAELAAAVTARQCGDGGFADHPGATEGTTTVTAAAIILLANAGATVPRQATEWLWARWRPAGGFEAAPRVVLPDLLSTATALLALRVAEQPLAPVAAACFTFVDSLWDASGGFVGHPLDDTPDCEYSFYALLALGILAEVV